MSAEDPGCQHSAGALKDGKLSEPTYNRIIQDIKDAGQLGFGAVSLFPCTTGESLPASIGLVPQDLEDKEKYPDFHKNVMGMFEKVALALDVKGNFSLPFPFWDPFALAVKLDLDMPSFEIPDLPTLTPPDLAVSLNMKLPELLDLSLSLPSIPKPPTIDIPTLDLKINTPTFDTFFQFSLWPLKLPDLVIGLAIPDVNIVLDLIKIPPSPCAIIEKVVKAQLFGPSAEGDLTKIIAIQELATFTGQCCTVAVSAMLVGDGGPVGVTGNLGTQYKWKEADKAEGNTQDAHARNTLIAAFKARFNRAPSQKEVQFAQIIAKSENGYGTSWAGMSKKAEIPPEAKASNNWGNIHGQGPAGSFNYRDYNEEGKSYPVTFAMFSSPSDGAVRLLEELYIKRPYVLEAVNNNSTLYKPTYLMSSRAVLGVPGYKDPNGKASSNAIVPPPEGLTYYVANPRVYFKSMQACLRSIMKNLKESTEFDTETIIDSYPV
jgi:hypothetical protein